MELKLINGDYTADKLGGFETVSGPEEKLERILYKLTCRKGGFAPMPSLGSELYRLLREKRESRISSARKYILEALEGENGIVLTDVSVSDGADGIFVKAEFDFNGEAESLTVHLS